MDIDVPAAVTLGQLDSRVGPAGLVVRLNPESIKAECVARGWSLAVLGRRAGLSRPTLTKAIRGQAVRPLTVWRIQRALGAGSDTVTVDFGV